ncbi:hypothetical protein BGZ51_002564 [Haplosporangium sp. Z 767]|nr:hypothetical protein BGZ51_002564 [Haplosporangium sp. Z 767]
MGSSIGIVVFQSQQMSMFSPTTTTTTAAGPGSEPCSTPPSRYPWSTFSTTLISAWVPLTVWLVILMTTTVLVRQKQFVPRMVSARHAILISQAVFGVFWVLIAGVQEVQDQMLLTTSITTPKTETAMIAQEEDALFVPLQQQQKPQMQALELSHTNAQTYTAQSMRVPLCVVWYMAVVLLGLATGLMTTSSTFLERQLERDLSGFNAQASTTTIQSDNEHEHQQNIDEKSTACASSSSASPTWTLNCARRYSCMQRVMLGMLVLTLLLLQMQFFQWIVASSAATIGDAATEGRVLTSTCLTLFGLLSSMTMMALGAKLVPAVHKRGPQISI